MRRFLVRLMIFAVTAVTALEIVLRTIVPAAEMPAGYQYADYGIMALDRSEGATGRHTMGRLGRPAFRWRVNNDGFNSAIDYLGPDERGRPCVAVIGNSYAQGLYSHVDEHLAARLQERLGGGFDCYNLASSGLPLSQSPLVAAFARDRYDPSLIVIQAGTSSVSRSLRGNGPVRFCRQYRQAGDTLAVVPPSRFTVDRRNRLLRRSALVRYLFYNANLNLGGGDVVQALAAPVEEPGTLLGLPFAAYDEVLDRTLADLRAAAPGVPVLIVFDADRKAMYAAGPEGGKPSRQVESDLLRSACARAGVAFLDLTDAFWEEYRRNGRHFDFADNYHWNPYAVEIVAGAAAAEIQARGLLESPARTGASTDR